jgi:hypothetical protein
MLSFERVLATTVLLWAVVPLRRKVPVFYVFYNTR